MAVDGLGVDAGYGAYDLSLSRCGSGRAVWMRALSQDCGVVGSMHGQGGGDALVVRRLAALGLTPVVEVMLAAAGRAALGKVAAVVGSGPRWGA